MIAEIGEAKITHLYNDTNKKIILKGPSNDLSLEIKPDSEKQLDWRRLDITRDVKIYHDKNPRPYQLEGAKLEKYVIISICQEGGKLNVYGWCRPATGLVFMAMLYHSS